MRRGAQVALLFAGLAAAGTADASSDPPAGLQGLLTPPQAPEGPPGCVRAAATPRLPVRAAPSDDAPLRGWLVFRPWSDDPSQCLAVAPSLETPGTGSPTPVPSLESGYETPALLVLERKGEWHRVQLHDGSGWLHAPADHVFEPLPALLMEKLTYATPAWSGELCRAPGQDCGRAEARPAQPLNVLASEEHEGATWLEVELTTEACGEGEPRTLQHGWLRARDGDGRPAVWFQPRGC